MALKAALIALVLAAASAVAAARCSSARARWAWGIALGASGAVAAWLLVAVALLQPATVVQYSMADGSATTRLHVPDPDLGYAPRAGVRVRAVRRADRGNVFDARYTIADDGWRVTPGDPAGPAVVFFGCSYTFGEGVADDETLPARLSAALGGVAHVENRAATGYGPHQMLRALETGRTAIPSGARVFYQALGDHVRRAAGKTPCDDDGPRYVLDGDGVRFAGPLHAPLVRPLRHAAARLVKYGMLPARVFGAEVTDDERELFVRIVTHAAARVRAAEGRFTVILWDDTPADADLATRLERRGLEVWRVSSLLPGVDRAALLIPGDTHPGPQLHRLLAEAVAARLTVRRAAPR